MATKNKDINRWAVRQPFNPKLSRKPNGKGVCYFREWNDQGERRERKKTFGPFDDPRTRADFDAWVSSLNARPRTDADTLAGLLLAWLEWREPLETTRAGRNFVKVVGRILMPYAGVTLGEFRSSTIIKIRGDLVEQAKRTGDRSRPYINKLIGRGGIGGVFKWGMENDYCSEALANNINNITPLTKKTAPGLRGKKRVKPCDTDHLIAAIDNANATTAAMLKIHYLTGMRPGEVRAMRWDAIDRSGPIWKYTPPNKNEWRQESEDDERFDRVVDLGPKAQAVLYEYHESRPDPKAEYIFTPREAWAFAEFAKHGRRYVDNDLTVLDRLGELTRNEAAAVAGVHVRTLDKWIKDDPREKTLAYFFSRVGELADHYDRYSQRTAYHNACKAAGVPPFNPRQVRKRRAVHIDAAEGREAVAAQLGHARVETSAIYTANNQALAARLAEKLG